MFEFCSILIRIFNKFLNNFLHSNIIATWCDAVHLALSENPSEIGILSYTIIVALSTIVSMKLQSGGFDANETCFLKDINSLNDV